LHRIAWVVVAIYVVFGGVGAGLGAFAATSTVSVEGAVIGLIVGLLAAFVAGATVSSALYVREVRKVARRNGG
jgi:hypothetical protein